MSGAFVLVAAADGELSRAEADRFLEVVRDEPDHVELVASAAKIAADADGRLQTCEASVMGEIRQALGLREG